MQVGKETAQKWLVATWVALSAAIVLLAFLQSEVVGMYGDQKDVVWEWLLGGVVPTATLMLGVLVSNATQAQRAGASVDGFVFGLALLFSTAYLLAILAILGLAALKFSLSPITDSKLYLSACHGLVTALLGAFFVSVQNPKAQAATPVRGGPV